MKNVPFYPSCFHWKLLTRKRNEVEKACEILNTLTEEQIEAVEFLVSSSYKDGFDDGYDSANGE